MSLMAAATWLISIVAPAICHAQAPAQKLGGQARIEGFQAQMRSDNYGIASFTIANETDRPLNSIELTCWDGDDRAHGTKVLVWPSPGAIPAHGSQRFSNVNIGLFGASRSDCEVTGGE